METEEANFRGSFYSRTKALAEEVGLLACLLPLGPKGSDH